MSNTEYRQDKETIDKFEGYVNTRNYTIDSERDAKELTKILNGYEKQIEELKVKADMLDTIFNCDRVRVLGFAREGYPEIKDGKIDHIGFELWTKYPSFVESDEHSDELDRETLTRFLTQLKD